MDAPQQDQTRKVSWLIPTEAARAMALTSGFQVILDLELKRRAVFKPHAELMLGDNGFIADLQYDDPKYPGQVQHVSVMLSAVPKENAYLAPRMVGVRT